MSDQILDMVRVGLEALRAGDAVRAAQIGEQATRMAPARADGWLLLSAALTRMGSVDDERAMEDALAHIPPEDPAHLMIEIDRARALASRGRAAEAAAIALRVRDRPHLTPGQHDTLGSVFAMVALFDEALHHCQIAAAALPDQPLVLYNLATALRYLGRIAEAEAAFEKAIALDPQHSLGLSSLSALRKWTPERNHVDRLRHAISQAPEKSEEAARLHYSLFRELNDIGRSDEAWEALSRGAEITRAIWPYPEAEKRRRTETLISSFPQARLRSAAPREIEPPQPIFIVGLPRSGTTLTERILAAHSEVTALGETFGFSLALRNALGVPRGVELDNAMLERAGAADWATVARGYQDNIRYLAGGARVVTEKLPHNYELVGPIHMAFPTAPIVHVRRSPMDSLFGAFRIHFSENAYLWSYGMESLAENYRLYRRLMAHWRDALGDRLVEVRLEHLIDRPDAEIRRILSACGLAFEPACLSPHDASGGVATASSAQVRNPINREGVGAWRRYARQLEPLRAMLERDGFVDAAGDPVGD